MSWAPQVPLPLLADPNLSDAEVRVLVAVIAHVRPADGKMWGWPGNARLAEMTRKDERTVRRLLASLEASGYVKRSVLAAGGQRTLVVTLPYDGWSVSSVPSGQDCPGGEVTDDRGGRSRMTAIRNEGKERREEEPPSIPPQAGPPPAAPESGKVIGEVKSKPPAPGMKEVDQVLAYFNEVAGTQHPTGGRRNKAVAQMLLARLKDQTQDGRVDRAVRRAKGVIDEKWVQTSEPNGDGRPRFDREWFRLSTLFRPSHFDDYLEQARARERGDRA